MAKSKKQLLDKWEIYRRNLLRDTAIDGKTSYADILKHKAELEADPIKWIEFMFKPKYPFAKFHKKFFNRIVNNPEWYEVISWSRELAKTTCTMYIILYLVLTGKKKNILLLSCNYDNAERLLEPYRAQLDTNQRIKAFYGEQLTPGHWEKGDFRAACGANFRGIGLGGKPRGTKSEDEIRPDAIIPDDVDTDEDVRNPDMIQKNWEFFEKAVYPTRSISDPLLVIWNGNKIAKDCCITRAGAMADHWDIVNIRTEEGNSTWPEKNSEANINRTLSKITTRAQQGEYFNNPLSEGDIFKEITWGKCPPLNKLDFVVSYSDPSPSNKDRQKKGVSYKANVLLGYYKGRFYVYKCFLEQTKNYDFVEWNWFMRDYVRERTQVYYYIENNTLQDPFYRQVYIPIFQSIGAKRGFIPISPDVRKKPEKGARIEGNLEPLNRQGLLVFNIDEKENPHMKRLEEQFLLFTHQLNAPADGTDCVEGGWWILNKKIEAFAFEPSFGNFKDYHNNMY